MFSVKEEVGALSKALRIFKVNHVAENRPMRFFEMLMIMTRHWVRSTFIETLV